MRPKRGTPQHALLLDTLTKSRITAGLTQAELAELLGAPQSYVSKYELGLRRLDVIEFIAICRAISLDPAGVVEHLADATRPPRKARSDKSSKGARRGPRRKKP